MNTRFYNAKILVLDAENHFSIAEDELHVTGDTITYIGPGRKADPDAAETSVFDREIDARGNLLIPGFKNAHTHTPMTFLRSYADDLPLHEWLERQVFPNEAKLAGDDVYWLNILGIKFNVRDLTQYRVRIISFGDNGFKIFMRNHRQFINIGISRTFPAIWQA